MVEMIGVTPALPVRDVPRAVAFYRERLGFEAVHEDDGFAVVQRGGVTINLWEANSPGTPGAEPHLAGSASCRVEVRGLRELYDEMRAADVVHPNGPLRSQPWGVDDFSTLDLDGNLVAFWEPTSTS